MEAKDAHWPERCILKGCLGPTIQPHHHHIIGGSIGDISILVCDCPFPDQPGTRPKDQ